MAVPVLPAASFLAPGLARLDFQLQRFSEHGRNIELAGTQ